MAGIKQEGESKASQLESKIDEVGKRPKTRILADLETWYRLGGDNEKADQIASTNKKLKTVQEDELSRNTLLQSEVDWQVCIGVLHIANYEMTHGQSVQEDARLQSHRKKTRKANFR